MERARRLANRAILKRLVNESKQCNHQGRNESATLLNSSSPVLYSPSSTRLTKLRYLRGGWSPCLIIKHDCGSHWIALSNASLLDEGTAAAEAMAMCNSILKGKKRTFIVASNCHPQTIDICKTRAEVSGTEGEIYDYENFIKNAHANGVKVVMATDLLALTVLKPLVNWGLILLLDQLRGLVFQWDMEVLMQHFWLPHKSTKGLMPGRIIGVSVDSSGKPALRMAMQTREQHIRRDRLPVTSALLKPCLQHGCYVCCLSWTEGLKAIAQRVHGLAGAFALD
ncbi:hypothetical protein GH714_036939 [Hevea brasiliensis]|uniref:Glycine cleavage system P-protein N-terminal domain-containing protein n=1 Tax=Hevea brasiliensis TaxID=3981 RepID=A0A6A6KGF9_HEVBR|nr:hypothetical protein GH714_036939 [Hevea brasiliensis]